MNDGVHFLAIEKTPEEVSIADVAHTWYRAPQNLPPGVNKGGLEVTAGSDIMDDALARLLPPRHRDEPLEKEFS